MKFLFLLVAVFTVGKVLSIIKVDSCKSLSLANGWVRMTYIRRDEIYHAKAYFNCDYGYDRYGVESVTCETSGNWSDDPATCDVLCAPLSVANGLVEYSKSAFKGDYLTDTVATITCNSGYLLRGPSSRTCRKTPAYYGGSWTDWNSRCDVGRNCRTNTGTVGRPRNGGSTLFKPQDRYRTVVPHGYTVSFECPAGKTLVGPTTSTCQDGTWSHRPQSCEIQ